jgi:peptidoglycan/xylan/chitin deacetylase (PgdA/CDA1 family)
MPDGVPILLYHSVAGGAAPRFRRWVVSPEEFSAQMAHLAAAGYRTLTVGDYGRWMRGEIEISPPAAVITFDDGFADFRTTALPVLLEHGLAATLYLTSGYLGGTAEWLAAEGEGGRAMLTWEDVEAVAGAGIEIGAHGHSHRQFDTIRLRAAVADMARSKEAIEGRLGRSIATAAYPHGYSTPALRRAVRELGFTTVCGVKHALSSRRDDPLALARVIVEAGTEPGEFAALLEGEGLRVAPPTATLGSLAWRWYRRVRSMARRASRIPA